MKKKIVVILCILAVLTVGTSVYGLEGYLMKVVDGGRYLILKVGPYNVLFEVLYGGSIDSSLWLPPSRCVIVNNGHPFYKIINVDDNEVVEARVLK